MDFKSKTVLITGASSGIGEALVFAFSERQCQLIICGRNTAELERVKLESLHPENVKILPLDLSNYKNIKPTVTHFLGEKARIDILVNNAGLSQRSLALETGLDVDEQLIHTNLLGTIALTKALLPYLLKNEKSHIIVITSVVGKLGAPMRSSYAAAKHGLHGFFDTLRAELGAKMQILLVVPGFVQTNISKNALTASGKNQGTMDEATAKGFAPAYVATKIIRAIETNKAEITIAKPREKLAVYLKRFAPRLLRHMVENAKTT